MSNASAGIVGALAARRPLLATSLFAVGMTALSAVGMRNADGAGAALASNFLANALIGVALPVAIAASEPRGRLGRAFYLGAVALVAVILLNLDRSALIFRGASLAPPQWLILTALGLTAFLVALRPMTASLVRMGVLAPLAAILGLAGAVGHLAVEGLLTAREGAATLAIALAIGVSIGGGVSADFNRYFTRGFGRRSAAGAAGYAGVAPLAFAMMTIAVFLLIYTVNANFGAVEWRVVWGGLSAAAAACIAALIAVVGALSLENVSEMAAVDENRRTHWFAKSWRPVRRLLPPPTAIAVSAIAGVVGVVALFEAGFATPVSIILFFVLIGLFAALCFVSLRTSVLIVALLGLGALGASLLYAVAGAALPDLFERLTALTLSAAALGHLTVSWRDAGDRWRNARDIAEHALSDGLRRFLFIVGAGAASLFISGQSFAWAGGADAAQYFLVCAFFHILLAPPLMIFLSARYGRY